MTSLKLVSVLALSVAIGSCGIVGSDYEPTDGTFRKRLGIFISGRATDVDPIYGNVDVTRCSEDTQ